MSNASLFSACPWPHKTPSLAQIHEAGFELQNALGMPDRVECPFCGLGLNGWEHRGDPLEEHQRGGDLGLPTILKCSFLIHHPSLKPAPDTYLFDPEGDVRLLLKREDHIQAIAKPESPLRPNIFFFHTDDSNLDATITSLTKRMKLTEHNDEWKEEMSTTRKLKVADYLSQLPPGQIQEEELMLVSSRHLMLASPVFKSMLQPRFAEGLTLQRDGKVVIPIFDDDCAALQILLNIIHGRTRRIPETINIQMFTMFVVLVDKYQAHEVVEFFTNIWFNKLKYGILHMLRDNLYPWLCICWVLRRKEEFRELTRIAQLETTGRVDEHISSVPADLPVPVAVIGKPHHSKHSEIRSG